MNTMIYTHSINFEDEEFHVVHTKNLQGEDELIKTGFDFVRFSEQYRVANYRKRK